ncbi:MAG: helix-turn-helix domain-containing protein [Hyphomicrobiales bacterium]
MARTERERDEDDSGESSAADIRVRLERLSRLIRQGGHAGGLLPVHWEILRFLARASRHAAAPGGITAYLALTKGTTSQSLSQLVRKGLVTRQKLAADARQQRLGLTPAAHALLAKDPLLTLEAAIASLGGKTRRRLDRGLADLLDQQIRQQELARFGTCESCKLLLTGDGGTFCGKDKLPLSAAELGLLCSAHTPA